MNSDMFLHPTAKVRLLYKAAALMEYSIENLQISSSSHISIARSINGTTVPLQLAIPATRQKELPLKEE